MSLLDTHAILESLRRPSHAILIVLAVSLFGVAHAVRAQAVITVTSTADNYDDDADLTLAEAISLANGDFGLGDLTVQEQALVSGTPGTGGGAMRDEIRFNISGTGPHEFQPAENASSATPEITDPVFINGLSQPGASCATWPPTLQIVIDGNAAPSYASAFVVSSGGSLIRGLVINDFPQKGIELRDAGGNTVECNFIGTNASGTTAEGNSTGIGIFNNSSNNTIGGTTESARNLISGNSFMGIGISPASGGPTSDNVIQGNFIGTDATGTSALANGGFGGIYMSGSSGAASANNQIGGTDHDSGVCNRACNLISGNGDEGIALSGFNSVISGTLIEGNFIGTALNGTDPLGNGGAGVQINEASDNSVGGLATGAGNRIANNGDSGITVLSGTGNQILGNRVFDNAGLGIDIDNAGVTGNDTGDPDAGANQRQNYPVIDGLPATTSGSATTSVTGSLNSAASTTYRVEFFASQTCDASDFGEGERFLGGADVTTNGSGDATINESVNTTGVPSGWFITATATDPNGNSSEFSQCSAIAGSTIVTNTNNDGAGSLRDALDFANVNPGTDTITFDIDAGTDPGCSGGVCTIQPLTKLPTITSAVVVDGLSQTGADCSSWPPTLTVVLDGSAAASSVGGLQITGGGSTVKGLVVQNFGHGLGFEDIGGNNVQCNFIGTDVDGLAAAGNSVGVYMEGTGSLIGGTGIGDRNLISGNSSSGVLLTGDGNTVQGNLVGTNVSGAAAIGNNTGVSISGSSNLVGGTDHDAGTCNRACNVLSGGMGSSGYGVRIQGGGSNTVEGNFIGTDLAGSTDLGNGPGGVGIFGSSDNVIGGTASLSANLIAFNDGSGVVLNDVSSVVTTGNSILGNSIYSNEPTGIDLGFDGVTANDTGDVDGGANNGQNFPDLAGLPVTTSGGATTNVTGSLESAASTTFRIEFFANETCSLSNFGEGQRFLGFADVSTNGSGTAAISESVNTSGVPSGWFITATATDPGGNTSEFSGCTGIPPNTALVTNTNDSGSGSLRSAIEFANTNSVAATMIEFDIPTSDPGCDGSGLCVIQPTSAYPEITEEVIVDGLTQPGASCASWPPTLKIMLDGTSTSGSGLLLGGGNSTVRGLVIGNFNVGVRVESNNNEMVCNYLGTDPTGTSTEPNGYGVSLYFASGNTVGGPTPTDRNLISGNSQGVSIFDANGNTVQGNYIGTDAAGTGTLGNTSEGVSILECTTNTIEDNVIANNGGVGVEISRGSESPTTGPSKTGSTGTPYTRTWVSGSTWSRRLPG